MIQFLIDDGYKLMRGSTRCYKKGAVFIAINKNETKCLITRRHPLRPELEGTRSQFNVIYRGINPFTNQEFTNMLWNFLGLNRDYRADKLAQSDDDMIDDAEVILDF